MVEISFNVDVSKINYNEIIELVMKKPKESRSIIERILSDIILHLIKFKPINKPRNKLIHSKLSKFVKKNMSADIIIKTFDLKIEGETINISLDCSIIVNLNDILSFVETKINLKDENMKSIIISSIRAVKEIVDDDSKLKLIDHVLNDSSEEICRYLSNLISEKMFQIQIDNIEFEY